MSGAGFTSLMNSLNRNNRRLLKDKSSMNDDCVHVPKRKFSTLKFKKATPEQVKRVKEKIRQQKRKEPVVFLALSVLSIVIAAFGVSHLLR